MLSVLDLWPTGILFLRAELGKRFHDNKSLVVSHSCSKEYCAIHRNMVHMKRSELAWGLAMAVSPFQPQSLAQPMKPTKSWEEEKDALQERKQEEDI